MNTVSRIICIGASLALMLISFVPVSAGEKVLVITPKTKEILDRYLKEPYPLALAVSADGMRADYVFCSRPGCNTNMPIHQRDALNYCGSDCVILAVGKEIKLPYEVAEPPPATVADLPLCQPGSFGADFPEGMPEVRLRADTCTGFRGYMGERHFKAFAVTDVAAPDVTWGWASLHKTAQEAITDALAYCKRSRTENGIASECRLYAIGNIVVYDLPTPAEQAAIETYGKDREALNADLPPG